MRERGSVPPLPSKKIIKTASLLAAAEIGLAGVGALPARGAEISSPIREHTRQERVETKLPSPIEKELRAYEKQKTALTPEEIQKELSRCGFIDGKPTVYTYTPHPLSKGEGNLFEKGGKAYEALAAYVSMIRKSDPNQLSVVQLEFYRIGESVAAAFYIPSLKTIFLNQSEDDPRVKRQNLSSYLLQSALILERDTLRSLLQKDRASGSITEEEMVAKLDVVDKNMYVSLDSLESKELSDLSSDTLQANTEALTQEARIYRWHKEMDRIAAETSICHEAFHAFYAQQLGHEGYEGPSMDEILAFAFLNFSKRFSSETQWYAPLMESAIENYNGEDFPIDEKKIIALSHRLTQEFDLRTEPPDRTPDEWQKLSKQEQVKELTHKHVMIFLTEYLARIYNGALGNTPESVAEKLKASYVKFGISYTPYFTTQDTHHKPTQEELNLLKRMKWHGKPLVP